MKDLRLTPVTETRELVYEGVKLIVARWGNDEFVQKQRDMLPSIEGKTLTAKDERLHLAKICAGSILVGWSDFVLGGEPVEYSPENAEALLANDRDCHNAVVEAAMDLDAFRTNRAETTVKKS